MSLDVIRISGLSTKSVLGAYPSERSCDQTVLLDVALFLDTRKAAASGKIRHTVDYGRLAGELRFLLHACRFTLLETAAEALSRYVLAPPLAAVEHPPVDAVAVTLTKPNAPGGITSSLTVERAASAYTYVQETKDFGLVDVIHEAAAYGIYRLRLAPGQSIQSHRHAVMKEHELVLGSGLLLQQKPVAAGLAFSWPAERVHRYDNPTAQEQAILCVDRPKFLPYDEIPMAAPPEGLTALAGTAYYHVENEAPYREDVAAPASTTSR